MECFIIQQSGKLFKAFGPDDHDALKALSTKVEIHFITADKRGFDITKKRIVDDMEFPLHLVSNKPKERWLWIKDKFKENYEIVFIGDGIYDFYCLKMSDYSFTMSSSLFHVKKNAAVILRRNGGERAVAEACILIDQKYKLGVFDEFFKGKMKEFDRTIGV